MPSILENIVTQVAGFELQRREIEASAAARSTVAQMPTIAGPANETAFATSVPPSPVNNTNTGIFSNANKPLLIGGGLLLLGALVARGLK